MIRKAQDCEGTEAHSQAETMRNPNSKRERRAIAPALAFGILIGWGAASAFAQSGGGYLMRKSVIGSGGGTAVGGQYRMSGTVGQHDASEPAGGSYLMRGGFWAPAVPAPVALLADPTGIDKTRYLSFQVPAGQAGNTALQVTLVSLMHPNPPNLPQFPPPNFSAQEGSVRYVGTPSNCAETESPPTSFKCATLQCTPVYMDWEVALAGQTLHVTGQAVIPSSTYEIRQLGASCQGNESPCTAVSLPLTVRTQRWGDVASAFQAPAPAPLTQPNISDVAACVDKFKSVPTAIIVARADVNPAVPNGRVDIADVANIVDAFKNLTYPYPGPTTCP
ncbi:MAG: hypothetical protein HY287_07090 [Planctomycetes bacterium]|nr:hypothetical protein [Planctomycetota bacterium]